MSGDDNNNCSSKESSMESSHGSVADHSWIQGRYGGRRPRKEQLRGGVSTPGGATGSLEDDYQDY